MSIKITIKHIIKFIYNKVISKNTIAYLKKYEIYEENNIFTHLTFDEKIALHKALKKNKNDINCVEIGSYLGASTCFIANAISNKSKLFCIDTWGNDNMINEGDNPKDENLQPKDTFGDFIHNTKKYKEKLILIRKWSTEAIEDLKKQTNNINFLFIDGDHSYEGAKKDWDLYSPLLKKGSIVAFHDTGWAEGVQRVIQEEVLRRAVLISKLPNMQVFTMMR